VKRTKQRRTHIVHPELIGRSDKPEIGRWDVSDCPAERGTPRTDPVGRRIYAPAGDTEYERVIRGHELVHAKVSPADDWPKWLARGVASEQHLVVCEEARVNALAQRAGFDVATHLKSEDEMAFGKRYATNGDWRGAAMMAAALAGTAGFEPMVKGVASVNPEMARQLRHIGDTVTDYFDGISSEALSSTAATDDDGLFPRGFTHTEILAEWLERISGGDGGDCDDGDDDGVDVTDKHGPHTGSGTVPRWVPLSEGRTVLTRMLSGALGKTRIASDVGRNPRRMHRYLTDRRVFDRTRRHHGGVVLIDVSGSMSLSHGQVEEIVRAAPGCTVACYSSNGRIRDGKATGDNLWVLARNGYMVDESELKRDRPRGNCVDLPALMWAVSKRGSRKGTPVVWVCDGIVTGEGDRSHPILSEQVARYAKQHRIYHVGRPDEAVNLLKGMARGNKPQPTLTGNLRHYR
jgi:hypothetical protein